VNALRERERASSRSKNHVLGGRAPLSYITNYYKYSQSSSITLVYTSSLPQVLLYFLSSKAIACLFHKFNNIMCYQYLYRDIWEKPPSSNNV
jgi:hypothetical protein